MAPQYAPVNPSIRPLWAGAWRHARDGAPRHGFLGLLAVAAGPGADEPLHGSHKFLVAQGALYAVLGGVGMVFPRLAGVALRMHPPLDEGELAMLPLLACALLVLGYLYAQGGRSNAPHFLAWSCAYRVVLVPLGVVGLWLLGVRPQLCLALGVAEGVLGSLTLLMGRGGGCSSWMFDLCNLVPRTHVPTETPRQRALLGELPGRVGWFLAFQGVSYAGIGIGLVLWPDWCISLLITILAMPPSASDGSSGSGMGESEIAMTRLGGSLLAGTGWLYIHGGLSNRLHFLAATCLDRAVMVPFMLALLALLGARLHLCVLLGVGDPVLTLLTYLVLIGCKDGCALCYKVLLPALLIIGAVTSGIVAGVAAETGYDGELTDWISPSLCGVVVAVSAICTLCLSPWVVKREAGDRPPCGPSSPGAGSDLLRQPERASPQPPAPQMFSPPAAAVVPSAAAAPPAAEEAEEAAETDDEGEPLFDSPAPARAATGGGGGDAFL